MSTLRRAATRDIVMLTLGIVILAVAVVVFMKYGSGDSAAPTDESSWTYYICENCDAIFYLDGAELDRALNTPGELGSDESGKGLVVRCKECKEIRGVRGNKCPQHGEFIKINPGKDDPQQCSQCDFRG